MTGSHDDVSGQSGIPSPGDTIASKYVVEGVLGVGGMGVVVAARHAQLGRRVAIKFMRAEVACDEVAVARFLREARAVVAITSEHVARVLDVGTLDGGAPYIVMEFLAGEDLAVLLERRGRLGVAEAVGLLLQACEAIAEAHALGIVHRDLKPSNLFVSVAADGTSLLKVLDFGISKVTPLGASAAGADDLTSTDAVLGSPRYMSPEQLRSMKAVDAKSDVWALGVILYELIAGAPAFAGETLGDLIAQIVLEPPPPLHDLRSDVPRALAATIEACVAKTPDARLPSVAALAERLLSFAPPGSEAVVQRIGRIAGPRADASRTEPHARPRIPDVVRGRASETLAVEPTKDTRKAWLRAEPETQSRATPRARPRLLVLAAATIGAVGLAVFAIALTMGLPRPAAGTATTAGSEVDARPIPPGAPPRSPGDPSAPPAPSNAAADAGPMELRPPAAPLAAPASTRGTGAPRHAPTHGRAAPASPLDHAVDDELYQHRR